MPCGLIVSIRLFFFVIIYLVHSSWSRSILFDRNQRDSIISIEKNFTKERRHSIFDDKNGAILGELHTFLSNYGYLPRSDLETRAMRTDEEFRSAIRRLQTFASIPVTGKLDSATLELIRRPRCGLADYEPNRFPRPHLIGNRRRRYVLQGQKWAKTYLTYKIMNYTPDMPRESVDRAIYHALLIWSYPSQLRFRQANDLEHPDIEFLFAQGYHKDGYQFDGKGSVLAHAFYPEEHLGGDVHYDEDEDWTAYRENEYGLMDLFSVTVHELGHSLGLMHSHIPEAIMFPYYRGYSKNIKLHSDDIAAVRKLYGDPPSEALIPSLSDSNEITTVISPNQTEESQTTPVIITTTTTTATTTISTSLINNPTMSIESKFEENIWNFASPLTTTSIPTITTTITTTTRTTTTTTSTAVMMMMNEAQLQNENRPSKIPLNRTRNRLTTNPTGKKSTDQWIQSFYQTRTTTEPMKINYTDRSKLDLCEGFYDAITMYKGVLFIFKGQFFWQYDRRGLDPLSPMVNNAFWLGLPENLEKVDAAYERADGRLMLFAGRQYWIFEDNRISIEDDGSTYPRNLSSLGLPSHVDHIDAAFFWSFNRQAYLVWSNLYWTLDERWNRVNTYDYPRDMTMWQGIDIPLDDAFVDLTGTTYFFKGLEFWRLNDTSMESAVDYPRLISSHWLFCDKPRSSSSSSFCSTRSFHLFPSLQFLLPLLLLLPLLCSL